MKTLKWRIIVVSLLFGLFVFSVSSIIMYFSLLRSIEDRIDESYSSHLAQTTLTINNNLLNLYTSLNLFSPFSYLSEEFTNFYDNDNLAEKAISRYAINEGMQIVMFANPNLNLAVIYPDIISLDSQIIATSHLVDDFDPSGMKQLHKNGNLIIFSPHKSNINYNDTQVISALQKYDTTFNTTLNVYVETNFELIMQYFNSVGSVFNTKTYYLLLNEEDEIVFADKPGQFTIGEKLSDLDSGYTEEGDFKVYQTNATQGFSVALCVDTTDYFYVRTEFLNDYLLLFPLLAVISFLLGFIIFQWVNKPLQQFYRGVLQMGQGNFDSRLKKTKIYEFDVIIDEINSSKQKISKLFDEVRAKENQRTHEEVGRLRAQINPHFLLNTLNTVHWLALVKEQAEIGTMVSKLTTILSYNLQKDSEYVSVEQEIQATIEYLELQKLKYDFTYCVNYQCPAETIDYMMPRFILQPIVENSILHGDYEELHIEIFVYNRENKVIFVISDNAGGVEGDLLLNLNDTSKDNYPYGIGLNYVFKTLDNCYGELANIVFENKNNGLVTQIEIPQNKGDVK